MSHDHAETALVAEEILQAKSISFVGCVACQCGKIHIRFHDERGAIFAIASMHPPIAALAVSQLNALVEASRTSDIAGMPPEGSA